MNMNFQKSKNRFQIFEIIMHIKKRTKLVILKIPLRLSSSWEALKICSRENHSYGVIWKRHLTEDADLLNRLTSLHEETESPVN